MENDVKSRVKQALKELDISATAVAKNNGMSDRTLLDQVNGSSKISVAAIEALLAYRADISAEWLLRGVGSMLKTSTSGLRDGYGNTNDVDELKTIISRQRREIDGLYERVAELKGGAEVRSAHLA